MKVIGPTTSRTEKAYVCFKLVGILAIGKTTKDRDSVSLGGRQAASTVAIGRRIKKKVLEFTNGSQVISTVANGLPVHMNTEVIVVILVVNMLVIITERENLMVRVISFIPTVISGSEIGKMEFPLTSKLVSIQI